MPTNLAIDDRLIAQAQKLGRHKSKKDTVNAALDEYIRRRKQAALIPLFGTARRANSALAKPLPPPSSPNSSKKAAHASLASSARNCSPA